MSVQQNDVVNLLRGFAKKLASAPDRMTTADGQGGITTTTSQPAKDPGESELKQSLPADGTPNTSDDAKGVSSLTQVIDAQGGITTSNESPKKDSGEDDIKQGLPADGTTLKSARVEAIRSALFGKNPNLNPAKSAGEQQAAPAATVAPVTQKQAGEGDPIELSRDLLAKIASDILATEDGINFVYGLQEKAAGAQAARAELTSALHAAEYYDEVEQMKSAAMNDVFSKAAAIHDELSQLISERDADEILKTAAIHQSALLELEDGMLKIAYAAGMDDAALLEAAAEAEAGKGAEAEAPAEGGELPMSGEEGLGEEEVLQLLQELIESGELSEEEVMEALQATEGEAPPVEEPAAAGELPM